MAQIDSNIFDSFVVALRRWRFEHDDQQQPAILAVDGGSRSAGWCHFAVNGTIRAGEGTPDQVISACADLLALTGPPVVFVLEGPYTVSLAQMTTKQKPGAPRRAVITPHSIYKLGFAAGYIKGGLSRELGSPICWEPPPMTWRSFVKLNRRATDDSTARDETAAAVIAFARERTGLALETENGRDKIDQANAIGMAFAAATVVRDAMKRSAQ